MPVEEIPEVPVKEEGISREEKMDLYDAVDRLPEKQKTVVIPRSIPGQNQVSWGISIEGTLLHEDTLHFYLPKWLWSVFPLRYRNYKTNVLHVTVPCIDDQFFSRAWIQGEYMKVCDEGLVWRGQLFKREEKLEGNRRP